MEHVKEAVDVQIWIALKVNLNLMHFCQDKKYV